MSRQTTLVGVGLECLAAFGGPACLGFVAVVSLAAFVAATATLVDHALAPPHDSMRYLLGTLPALDVPPGCSGLVRGLRVWRG